MFHNDKSVRLGMLIIKTQNIPHESQDDISLKRSTSNKFKDHNNMRTIGHKVI